MTTDTLKDRVRQTCRMLTAKALQAELEDDAVASLRSARRLMQHYRVTAGDVMTPPTPETALPDTRPGLRLKFGKHKDKLLSEIVETDPAYAEWLLSRPLFQQYRAPLMRLLHADVRALIEGASTSTMGHAGGQSGVAIDPDPAAAAKPAKRGRRARR